MRYALIALVALTVSAYGQNVICKTATVVDGGHRIDQDTNGKRTIEPESTFTNSVLKQTFSYSDNSDADFYDLSAAGNDGAQTNANSQPTFSSANGGVYDFDGIDDYINLGASLQSVLNNKSFSISAWFKTTVTGWTILDCREYNNDDEVRFYPNAMAYDEDAVGVVYATISSTNTHDGAWHHSVGTVSASTASLYLDGVLVASSDASGSGTLTLDDDVFIGARGGNSRDGYFDGIIDDVRIYTRALTSNEVMTVYNNTSGAH